MAQYIIPAIAAVVVAVIEAIAAAERRQEKKNRKLAEQHAKDRAEETRLSMKMMSATLQLSVVTANALTGGHNNGNVEQARTAAQSAQAEYEAFMQRVTAQEVTR